MEGSVCLEGYHNFRLCVVCGLSLLRIFRLVLRLWTIEDGDYHEKIAYKADDRSHDSACVVKDSGVKMRVGATFSAHQYKTNEHSDMETAKR